MGPALYEHLGVLGSSSISVHATFQGQPCLHPAPGRAVCFPPEKRGWKSKASSPPSHMNTHTLGHQQAPSDPPRLPYPPSPFKRASSRGSCLPGAHCSPTLAHYWNLHRHTPTKFLQTLGLAQGSGCHCFPPGMWISLNSHPRPDVPGAAPKAGNARPACVRGNAEAVV